jgi:transposase
MSLISFIGTTNKETFIYWIQKHLLPKLKKGDVVIMDNASIHKSAIIKKLIESKKAKLIYQPPYSPFLNKIENYWSFLKKAMCNIKEDMKFNDKLTKVCNLKYG